MQKMLHLVALRRRMVRVIANTCPQAASASFTNVSVSIAPQLKGQFVYPSPLRDVIQNHVNSNWTEVAPHKLGLRHFSSLSRLGYWRHARRLYGGNSITTKWPKH